MKPLKISAKNLGYTALESFCPRCYWLKLQTAHNLPWQSFPGIFSSIDAFTKHCVHEMIDSGLKTGNFPLWMHDIQNTGKIVGYEKVPHWSKSLYVDEKSGITISGMADDIFKLDDGTFAIPDYKTAKYTDSQDKLLPMYEIQEICYPIIYGYKDAKLFLVYMEPQTASNLAYSCVTKSRFEMMFNATTVPVENDRKKVRQALTITREIFEMPEPPKAAIGCKDCEKLDRVMELMGKKSIEIENAHVHFGDKKTFACDHSKFLNPLIGDRCDRCGAIHNGSKWEYKCKKCGKEVKPGELVGLFVPYLCKECEMAIAEGERKSGNVCRMCKQPRSRCCC